MVSEGSSKAILLDFQRRPAGQVNCRSWQLTGRFSNGVWQALAWQEASGLQKRDRESPKWYGKECIGFWPWSNKEIGREIKRKCYTSLKSKQSWQHYVIEALKAASPEGRATGKNKYTISLTSLSSEKFFYGVGSWQGTWQPQLDPLLKARGNITW